MQNTQIRLVARPKGLPQPSDWQTSYEVISPLEDGDVLVKIIYISLDPAMRGWMSPARSYIPPVEIGAVMRAGAAGVVIDSKNDKYKVGDYVTGMFGVQQYFLSKEGKRLTKVDTRLAPLPKFQSVLGMTGMTAYFGLLDVGLPREGDIVVVSGAAGAVGMVVGQIAKIKGCKVVGIAGGQDKCNYLVNELGFDDAIDYKQGNLRTALRKACPDGIDVYFDNVGGETLDTCLTMLRMKARVVICGAISQYNSESGYRGPANYMALLVNRARMEGFVVFDYADRYAAAVQEMAGWMQQGQLKSTEHIITGNVEDFHDTLLQLFEGDKIGKLLLKIAEE
ncbi:MAG: NADP-dependent oxidoreductase [Saprospiraceae bacterium]